MVMSSNIAIGHRYLIVIYPLIVIAAADYLFRSIQYRHAVVTAVALLSGQVISNATIAPHFLAYFNGPSGGPEYGRKLLVDSNLDWGQALPSLRELLRRRDDTSAAVSYFGTADLSAYEVSADRVEDLTLDPDRYGLFAVSATNLEGVYADGDNPFRVFRDLTPAAHAGYSILVFELDTPEKRAAFRAAVQEVKRSVVKAKGLG
jgi:hypothetical protein